MKPQLAPFQAQNAKFTYLSSAPNLDLPITYYFHTLHPGTQIIDSFITGPHFDRCVISNGSPTIPKMARPKKGGAAARVRDSNSDFNPTKRSPTKNFTKGKSRSPQKKYINPRKGRKSEQEATVDQGIVAIPDNTLLQVQAQNDDSIYDSSPSKRIIISTSQPTPQQPSVRKDAARDNRSNKCIIDQSSGSFEAERAITTEVAAESATESKVVILRVTSHKLREILEIHIAQEKKVTLVLSPEKLRRFEKEPFAEELLPPPILRPEVPVVEEAAGMAPVKDKNPHDVLDGGSFWLSI